MTKITGHGLKLDKVKQTFSSFNAMPPKLTEKNSAEAFGVWVRELSNHACTRHSVSSPDEAPKRELKIRRATENF